MPSDTLPPDAFGPLTDLQRELLRQYPPPHLFAVISWGNAATSWTAAALNTHPDILCLHGANILFRNLAGAPEIDGILYLRTIGALGHSVVAAGDVHGVSRHQIPTLRTQLGDQFRAAILVREPLSRLRSQLVMFQRYAPFGFWDVSYIDPHLTAAGFDVAQLSYSQRLFAHGANLLNAILDEQELAPVYRAEDITASRTALLDFADYLTGETIERIPAWAESAIARGAVNARAKSAEFSEWETHIIRAIVKPEAWQAYQALGYEVPPF